MYHYEQEFIFLSFEKAEKTNILFKKKIFLLILWPLTWFVILDNYDQRTSQHFRILCYIEKALLENDFCVHADASEYSRVVFTFAIFIF